MLLFICIILYMYMYTYAYVGDIYVGRQLKPQTRCIYDGTMVLYSTLP